MNGISTPELELELKTEKETDCAQNKSSDRGEFYSNIGKPTPKHIVDFFNKQKGE
jgi:hypothetical protein